MRTNSRITLYCLHSAIHCLVSAAYSNTLRHRCPALLHSRSVLLTVDPGYWHGSPPPAGAADQSPIARCPFIAIQGQGSLWTQALAIARRCCLPLLALPLIIAVSTDLALAACLPFVIVPRRLFSVVEFCISLYSTTNSTCLTHTLLDNDIYYVYNGSTIHIIHSRMLRAQLKRTAPVYLHL